jgi:ubiquinone/menaquinone biosynthesis C-methylase UbiE
MITTQHWAQYPSQRPLKFSLQLLKNTPRSLTRDAELGSSDGVDLSAEMLRHAKTRGYTKLFQYSLNDPLPISDGAYDAIISAGLFTHGHVKTHAIRELIRITKSGGYLCFTINEGVYHSQGFDKEIQSITDDKLWYIEKLEKEAYMTKEQVQAYYCLAQVR